MLRAANTAWRGVGWGFGDDTSNEEKWTVARSVGRFEQNIITTLSPAHVMYRVEVA